MTRSIPADGAVSRQLRVLVERAMRGPRANRRERDVGDRRARGVRCDRDHPLADGLARAHVEDLVRGEVGPVVELDRGPVPAEIADAGAFAVARRGRLLDIAT